MRKEQDSGENFIIKSVFSVRSTRYYLGINSRMVRSTGHTEPEGTEKCIIWNLV
jgi:hypothetical protein